MYPNEEQDLTMLIQTIEQALEIAERFLEMSKKNRRFHRQCGQRETTDEDIIYHLITASYYKSGNEWILTYSMSDTQGSYDGLQHVRIDANSGRMK